MFQRVTRQLMHGAAIAVDRAATLAMTSRRPSRERPILAASHAARAAFFERISAEYPEQPSIDFFGPERAIHPTLRRVRSEQGRAVIDATWPSAYEPFLHGIRARYGSTKENHFAMARLFVRDAPRPIAIIIHGYLTGHYPIEERLWPLDELDRLGFDAALFVLPFHALRGPLHASVPEFPNSDPRITVEGFRQAVGDLRSLIRWLRRRGHPRLGLMGMSLGGYTAALTATVEPDLDFLVPLIPLACLADFAKEQGSLSAQPHEAAIEHALMERIYRVTSPVALAPRIAPDRVLVVGARADRVTPVAHARKLANHFGAPLLAWHGGHVLQLGRRQVFQHVFRLMTRATR